MVAEIREKTPEHSSFGTKKSALVTLRKMGKSVALSECDEVGSEVTNILRQQGSLDGAMLAMFEEMSKDDRNRMKQDREWILDVRELEELVDGQDRLFEDLKELLRLLGQEVSDDEEESDEHEQDDEDKESEVSEEPEYAGYPGWRETVLNNPMKDAQEARAPCRNMCRGCGCGNESRTSSSRVISLEPHLG